MKGLLLVFLLLLTACNPKGGAVVLTLDNSIDSNGDRLLNALLIHFDTGTIAQEASYQSGAIRFNGLKFMNNYSIALRFIDKNKTYGLYSCQFPNTKNYLFMTYKNKQIRVVVDKLGKQNGVGVATCRYV